MRSAALFLLNFIGLQTALAADQYAFGPDSTRHPGTPQGAVSKHSFTSTRIFPGSLRDYWLYVPAQYKSDQPAALMVFQDGTGYVNETGHSRVPIVFDNLIHRSEMPVTIGVFADPGVLPAPNPATQQGRFNRSYEYDAVSDRYARFLIEELLPEVRKNYNITPDPNLHAIAGSSSGGIAAFTAAWFRPDAFRRVLSFIGSYTNLRNGHAYASLIRKTQPRPLRVFLQDGSGDQDIYSGSWFLANQDMAAALAFAGYDFKFVTGTEAHNMKHGGVIMPDALRWLWRDWKTPIRASTLDARERQYQTQIPDLSSDWQVVGRGIKASGDMAVDRSGFIYIGDSAQGKVLRAGVDGGLTEYRSGLSGLGNIAATPDGKLIVSMPGRGELLSIGGSSGSPAVVARDVRAGSLAITPNAEIYFSDLNGRGIGRVSRDGKTALTGSGKFTGLSISPDGFLLAASEPGAQRVWSFALTAGGILSAGQPLFRLENPSEDFAPEPAGLTVDTDGFLYVATRLGIQVCDPPGRVVSIIDGPSLAPVDDVKFAGPAFDYLFIRSGGTIFRRHMRRHGVRPGEAVQPPRPRL